MGIPSEIIEGVGWFGTYYSHPFPWVYHSSMGWLYIIQSKDGDAWDGQDSLEWV